MVSDLHSAFVYLGLFTALAAVSIEADGLEPPAKQESPTGFTHVITEETEYYITGPQQARPPEGKLAAGTKVKLLQSAGSYSRVQSEGGIVAYVASDALQEIDSAEAVSITDDVRTVARSNNEFAFDLYRHLREEEGNLFFSPASVSTALAMTYAGAAGQTREEMAQVLHFDLADERLHDAFATLSKILNMQTEGYELSMANRLWGQQTYPFLPDFLATTRQVYGAELAELDFAQTENARQQINEWVEEETNGRIEDLIPAGVLDAETRLVLTNAIYFKGAWDEEFSERATNDAPFHLSRERQVDVPMMRQTDDFRYAETEDLQLVELPYAGNDLSMVVLLPKEVDGLSDVERNVSAENVQQWIGRLQQKEVSAFLPKFRLTSQFPLADVLRSLGMPLAFSGQADFSRISTAEDLFLSQVIHKAYVDVNEQGTEAAAATGVILEPTAAPVEEEPVVFRADHPFLFLIRDNRTEAVLFLGRVTNPVE